jgi:hypothetical protein
MKYKLKNTFDGFEPEKRPYYPHTVSEAVRLVQYGHGDILPRTVRDLATDLNYVQFQQQRLVETLTDCCAAARTLSQTD